MSQDITKDISTLIQDQFPDHILQDGAEIVTSEPYLIVDFVKAYFEYLEENFSDTTMLGRRLLEYDDIDTTVDEFLEFFRRKYLADFPNSIQTDERFIVKNILDLYRSKGSEQSVKLLIKMLFNEMAEIYYPGTDILRASDSKWVKPIFVEVTPDEDDFSLVNKPIYGSLSGATAFVESIVRKRVQNRFVDIVYLSNVKGTFITGERITNDGVLSSAPKIVGSLSSITIEPQNIGGFENGDVLNIISDFGDQGTVRVTNVLSQTGTVDISLADGGYGYTLDSRTNAYISDLIVKRDNTTEVFATGDTVTQNLVKILLNPSESFTLSDGATIIAEDANNVSIANGTVMEYGTETISSLIYPYMILQTEENAFSYTETLEITTDVVWEVGDTLEESNDITFEIENANGVFTIGEIVYQQDFFANTSNTVSERYAFGEVSSANATHLVIIDAFGEFYANNDVITGWDSGAFAEVANLSFDYEGGSGDISLVTSNTEYTVTKSDLSISFTTGRTIRNPVTNVTRTIANKSSQDVIYVDNGTETANIYSISDMSYNGLVIGQNNITIGIASVDGSSFKYLANTSILINQNNVSYTVEDVDPGTGASYEIGTLTNTETISIDAEVISDTNIVGVPYSEINLDGSGSGVGYVSSVTVNAGGTGYTNGSAVTFTGGGFNDEEPLIQAEGTVLTSGGAITSVNITRAGEGFYSTPTISVADGSGANLELVMEFSYGFTANPTGDANTPIEDLLSTTDVEIGTIATLTNVTKGTGYTVKPYADIVVDDSIANPKLTDEISTNTTIISGSFIIGEVVTQANTDAKGIVLSWSASNGRLVLRDISYNDDFVLSSTGGNIIGADSGTIATINEISDENITGDYIGNNADLDVFVIETTGTINTVDIITSGYGYVDGEEVILRREGFDDVVGIARVESQGVDVGYWRTRNSHLNSEKRLHDNFYYQEFSYDVQSAINLVEYEKVLFDIVHQAGMKLFGTTIKITEPEETVEVESSITQV